MDAGGTSDLLFQTFDPQGRFVGLARETFELHIFGRHPGMTAEMIRAVIERPDVIFLNLDHNSLNYSVRTDRSRFRLVAVKQHSRRNPNWEVATAYPRSIPPRGNVRILWTRS